MVRGRAPYEQELANVYDHGSFWQSVRSLFMEKNSRLLNEVIMSTKRHGLQLKTQIPSYQ